MASYDGRAELRFYYSVAPAGFSNMQHKHTHDVKLTTLPDAGEPFTGIYTTAKDGSPDNALSAHADAFAVLLKPLFHESASIDFVELWLYGEEPSTDAIFISTYGLGEAGTAGVAPIVAQQTTLTFRSLSGGSARVQLMETSIAGNSRDPYPFAVAGFTAIADYLTASTSPMVARDNSFLNVAMNALGGQNERLFRKRYRS